MVNRGFVWGDKIPIIIEPWWQKLLRKLSFNRLYPIHTFIVSNVTGATTYTITKTKERQKDENV